MSWLLRHNWLWSLLAFLIGAGITWVLLERREHSAPAPAEEPVQKPVEEKEEVLVGAAVAKSTEEHGRSRKAAPDVPAEPRPVVREEPEPVVGAEPEPAFSQLMEAEPTLFDDVDDNPSSAGDTDATEPQVPADVPPGRYGEGSADAVPHQGPPDGFSIKGNAQSMLFHTPDSPYYGRTKPEVWFRTEPDAERAGFTKYARRPRKSASPDD